MRETMDERNMEKSRRRFVARVVKGLRDADSWTDDECVQKSVFLAQEVLDCQQNYGFYIYHYGPYCRDLTETLQFMRVFREIVTEPDDKWAPRFQLTEKGRELANQQVEELDKVNWATKTVAEMTVPRLEAPTTAIFLKLQDPSRTDEQVATELNRVKPYISYYDAMKAIDESERIRQDARDHKLIDAFTSPVCNRICRATTTSR